MTRPDNMGADASRGAKMLSLNDFVFDWFNERQPDEMNACLDAYDIALLEANEARPPAGEA